MGFLAASAHAESDAARRQRAVALWQERCKSAGEFIRKPVRDVEGVVLLTLRHKLNASSQFELDDPYGHDSVGEQYLLNFLRGYYHHPGKVWPAGFPPRTGYRFVEASDPKDGQLYRYTGRFEEPWQADKSYLKGYVRFVLDRHPIEAPTARYGVRFDDISTRQERELWIAGSSLKVVDLQTQEVVAERIGYMVDLAQGSRAGQRSPWLFAADNACPDFFRNYPSGAQDRVVGPSRSNPGLRGKSPEASALSAAQHGHAHHCRTSEARRPGNGGRRLSLDWRGQRRAPDDRQRQGSLPHWAARPPISADASCVRSSAARDGRHGGIRTPGPSSQADPSAQPGPNEHGMIFGDHHAVCE